MQSTWIGRGVSPVGKQHALHHMRAWSFGLSLPASSRLLISCVSYRFFPRFFLGLVFCGFLLILSYLRATNADCTLLRKIRRFPSNTRSKRVKRFVTLPRFSREWRFSRQSNTWRCHVFHDNDVFRGMCEKPARKGELQRTFEMSPKLPWGISGSFTSSAPPDPARYATCPKKASKS